MNATAQPQSVVSDSTGHVYHVNYAISSAFCAVATAANVYAIPTIIKGKRDLTPEELAAANPDIFSGFDRMALNCDPSARNQYYKVSDLALPGIIVATGALAFDKKIKKDWFRLLVMYYETHAVTFSIYNFSFLGPAFQNKLRPFVYYNYFTADERRGGNQRNSMYSGHTASASAATFFLVKVYSDYHPEIGNRKYLYYGLASIPPLVEGFFRMKALAHFPSDVMVGFGVGAICGVAVPALHRIRHQSLSLGITDTPVGPGLVCNWKIGPKQKTSFASLSGSSHSY